MRKICFDRFSSFSFFLLDKLTKSVLSLRVLRSKEFDFLKDYELEGGSKKVPFILKKWSELEGGHHEQVHELAKEISEMVAFPRVKRIEE